MQGHCQSKALAALLAHPVLHFQKGQGRQHPPGGDLGGLDDVVHLHGAALQTAEDADLVIGLYREGYYDKDAPNPNLAECIIAKNRHGETRTVELQWLPEFTTFGNLEWQQDEY